jgi:hypothetical protein
MTLDHDLSDLETSQSDLWLFLRVDGILAQLLADQAKSRASARSKQLESWPRRRQEHHRGRLRMPPYHLPGRVDFGALKGLVSKPVAPRALPASWSSDVSRTHVTSRWVH